MDDRTPPWFLFNLSSSPFFQDRLDPKVDARYPTRLFVGRDEEVRRILTGIRGNHHSRHPVSGPSGIGKTSLVQYLKSEVAKLGLIFSNDPVSVGHADSTETLLLRMIGYVYDAILTHGGERAADLEPVKEARMLVHAFRTRSGSLSLGLPGLGSIGGSTSVQHNTPGGDIGLPHVLKRLAGVVTGHMDKKGILVHLNNLENLSDTDQKKAAAIVRDLRDTGLMYEGYHYVLVGTEDALRTIVYAQPQIKSVFGVTKPLQPLTADEFERLLQARYEHLSVRRDKPARAPVTAEAVRELYALFLGDLRGTLKALEDASNALIGVGPGSASDPLTLPSMAAVLRESYGEEMTSSLSERAQDKLEILASLPSGEGYTQKELEQIWDVSQTTVSDTLTELQKQGYVVAARRASSAGPGRRAQIYQLGGAARLIYGV